VFVEKTLQYERGICQLWVTSVAVS